MPRPPALTDPAALALASRMAAGPWRLLRSGPATAGWNMGLDEALLDAAAAGATGPVLRFYTWSPPAVSLGHFQRLDQVDLVYAAEHGFDVVRRATGGRGVLHQHELTYSVVLPPSVVGGAGVRTSYTVLIQLLNGGLRRLLPDTAAEGVSPGSATRCDARENRTANCFALSSECDSVTSAGKLVGSAQVRRNGALLQHGSVLLDAEPEAWERLFGQPGSLATLNALTGRVVAPDEVIEAILVELREAGIALEEGTPTPGELAAAGSRENGAVV